MLRLHWSTAYYYMLLIIIFIITINVFLCVIDSGVLGFFLSRNILYVQEVPDLNFYWVPLLVSIVSTSALTGIKNCLYCIIGQFGVSDPCASC